LEPPDTGKEGDSDRARDDAFMPHRMQPQQVSLALKHVEAYRRIVKNG
jgi:hypothetical protein